MYSNCKKDRTEIAIVGYVTRIGTSASSWYESTFLPTTITLKAKDPYTQYDVRVSTSS